MTVPRKYRVFLWLAPLIALNWLGIAFIPIVKWFALDFGALFAQATLAAVWMTFGPLPFAYRAPLTLAVIAMSILAILINEDRFKAQILFASYLLVHFTTAAICLGAIRAFGGQSLRHADDQHVADTGRFRFGIGPMLFFTAIVAMLLAFGRLADPIVNESAQFQSWFRFCIFAAIGGIVTPPLLLAALSQRRTILRVMIYLLLLAIVVLLECLLQEEFLTDQAEILVLNSVTSLFTLAYAVAIRLNGYTLSSAG